MSRLELHVEVMEDGSDEDRFQIPAKNYEELQILAGMAKRLKKIRKASGKAPDLAKIMARIFQEASKAAAVRREEDKEFRKRR